MPRFGQTLETLRTPTTSFESALLIAYGMDTYQVSATNAICLCADYNLQALLDTHPVFGGLYTVLYLFVFIFGRVVKVFIIQRFTLGISAVMMNIFISIVKYSFEQLAQEEQELDNLVCVCT